MGKTSLTFTIDDLLTDETLWMQSCRKGDSCKEAGDKQEAVMRDLRAPPKSKAKRSQIYDSSNPLPPVDVIQ
jgi:hypothetical protein